MCFWGGSNRTGSMRKTLGLMGTAGLLLTTLLVVPSRVDAVMTLQLTIDELTQGRAVLSGNIGDVVFGGPFGNQADFFQLGTNWKVEAFLLKFTQQLNTGTFTTYNVQVKAQHISNPAPHPGEATPGLLLGGGTAVLQRNLAGVVPNVFGDPGPQDVSQTLIHPGSENHYDVLASHVDDLNGDAAGFLTDDNQLSVRIDLSHGPIPEPSSLFLFGSGLLGLVDWRRKRASA